MSAVLIVYTSRHGHTAQIARRMADGLRRTGAGVVTCEAAVAEEMDLHAFDAVIAGGSVHMERHDEQLTVWAERHAATLNRMRSGFFSVSLTAAVDAAAARAYADRFEEDTGWIPARSICLAGALQYREYSLPIRLMVRQIARARGLPTDTSRDHEFTDWAAVEHFAEIVAGDLTPVPAHG